MRARTSNSNKNQQKSAHNVKKRDAAQEKVCATRASEPVIDEREKVQDSEASAEDRNERTLSTKEVVQKEEKLIMSRRRGALFAEYQKEVLPSPKSNLVGLALSGGGIRSASFNLGILQAFQQCGLLRFVDYLSTVSGGGYIGAFFSSRINSLSNDQHLYRTAEKNHGFEPSPAAKNLLDLGPLQGGKQTDTVMRIIQGGRYLSRPLHFINGYLSCLILNNCAVFSALICFAAGIALIMRSLDYLSVRWAISDGLRYIPLLSSLADPLSDDLGAAFLPSLLLFSLWLTLWPCSWLVEAVRPGLGEFINKARRGLLISASLFILIAFAIISGNGDTGTGAGTSVRVDNPWLLGAGLTLLLCLIPILRPWRLIASGLRPQSLLDTFVFRITSAAILIGIPLFFVYLLAQENISGRADSSIEDILKWKPFFETVRQENLVDRWPGNLIASELSLGSDYEIASMPDILELNKKRAVLLLAARSTYQYLNPTLFSLLPGPIGLDATAWSGNWLVSSFPVPLYHLGNYLARPEEDLTPAVGVLQDSQYVHVVKRRQLTLRALNRLMDHDLLIENLLRGFDTRLAEQKPLISSGSKQTKTNGGQLLRDLTPEVQQLFVLSAMPCPDLHSNGETPSQPSLFAALDPFSPFARNEKPKANKRLFDLVQKYIYLRNNISNAKEFETEFKKPELRRELGRLLLQIHYPEFISDQKPATKRIVVIDYDQSTRWKWFLWSGGICIIFVLLVNLNSTSMHGFYRDRLAEAYLGNDKHIGLSELGANVKTGAPYHLLAAAHIVFKGLRTPSKLDCTQSGSPQTNDDKVKGQAFSQETRTSATEGFLFSPLVCGSNALGFCDSKTFEINRRPALLADAMALSGAAVSPLRVHNPLVRALMFILNIRLGQWLPRPKTKRATHGLRRLRQGFIRLRPFLLNIIVESLLLKMNERRLCFITDGGHYENLGVWPLLERHCRLIIVSDATQDGTRTFDDFLHLCRDIRVKHGIRFVEIHKEDNQDQEFRLFPLLVPPDGLKPTSPFFQSLSARFSRSHYLVAQIDYATSDSALEPKHGYLIYLKASLTGDEEPDLIRFCKVNSEFPHDPTSQAMFNEDQVESYRQLGYHIGYALCRDIGGSMPPSGNPVSKNSKAAPDGGHKVDRAGGFVSDPSDGGDGLRDTQLSPILGEDAVGKGDLERNRPIELRDPAYRLWAEANFSIDQILSAWIGHRQNSSLSPARASRPDKRLAILETVEKTLDETAKLLPSLASSIELSENVAISVPKLQSEIGVCVETLGSIQKSFEETTRLMLASGSRDKSSHDHLRSTKDVLGKLDQCIHEIEGLTKSRDEKSSKTKDIDKLVEMLRDVQKTIAELPGEPEKGSSSDSPGRLVEASDDNVGAKQK